MTQEDSPKEINNKRSFVLSVPSVLDPDGAAALKFISASFDALEVSDSVLSSDAFDASSPIANVTDIVPKTVSRGVDSQTTTIKNEFVLLMKKAFDRIREAGANSVTVDFGLDDCWNDDGRYAAKVAFLKRLAPLLYKRETHVRLPERAPNAGSETGARLIDVIRDSMCGLYRVELNIHPHELLSADPFEILVPHRFLMDSAVFVYEPEAGNFLVDKLLLPWFEALDELGFEGDVVFKPMASSWETLDDTVDSLSDLLKAFQS